MRASSCLGPKGLVTLPFAPCSNLARPESWPLTIEAFGGAAQVSRDGVAGGGVCAEVGAGFDGVLRARADAGGMIGLLVDLTGFATLARFSGLAFRRLTADLAILRASFATFFACFKALRASLNFVFARRACLRADSSCFSASAARTTNTRGSGPILPFVFLLVFIVLVLGSERGRQTPFTAATISL